MRPAPGTSSAPAGRLGLLRIRDFRNVFLAQSISVFGDGITPVALTFAVLLSLIHISEPTRPY